ncbi:hypothetical protein KJ940_14745, partial [Myxococcota bacterium]|nr:hypothetical protein [Myxococcota bacterium]
MYIPPLSPLRLPLIALALAACGPPPSPGPTEAEEAARRAFEAATARLDAGEVEAGEAQLLALVHEAPQGPYADAARYHLARLTLPRDPALASRQLLGLAPRLPAPLGAKATLYGAIGAARAGRCAQAEGPLAAALPTLEGAEAVDARLALARCTRPLLHVEAALRLG